MNFTCCTKLDYVARTNLFCHQRDGLNEIGSAALLCVLDFLTIEANGVLNVNFVEKNVEQVDITLGVLVLNDRRIATDFNHVY